MNKIRKIIITLSLFLTLIFTSVAPAFAFYGGEAWSGKIWPPVLTGWHMSTGGGNSSIDWTFSDPNAGVVSIGVPDLSSQYPDWNKPNNMDIVMWAQNHHIQTPLNSIFGWTAVDPGDTNPNYTGPIPCQYTPQILSIIESSGHSPSDFFAAGKAPLTSSAPAPTTTPAKVATPTSTPTTTPAKVVTPTPTPTPVTIPAPTVASPQVVVPPQVAQAIAQKHADPERDSSSMVSATVTKLDDAKQATEEKAKTDAYNRKFWWVMVASVASMTIPLALVALVIWLRKRRVA